MENLNLINATQLEVMAEILEDIKSHGFTPISARLMRIDKSGRAVYGYYAIKRHDLTKEIEDCYFEARCDNDGKFRYTPIDLGQYYNK